MNTKSLPHYPFPGWKKKKKYLLNTRGMVGYEFSELLNLVIEIKLYDTAYRNKKGKCQCTFKSKRQGMDC